MKDTRRKASRNWDVCPICGRALVFTMDYSQSACVDSECRYNNEREFNFTMNKEGNMKLFCRHEWEYIKKPSKIILVQCKKCGKTEFHSKNKKYIFSKLVNRTYCWCPKCNNDLVRDSFISDEDGIVTYRCSWCGHESVWDFGIAPIPILLEK